MTQGKGFGKPLEAHEEMVLPGETTSGG